MDFINHVIGIGNTILKYILDQYWDITNKCYCRFFYLSFCKTLISNMKVKIDEDAMKLLLDYGFKLVYNSKSFLENVLLVYNKYKKVNLSNSSLLNKIGKIKGYAICYAALLYDNIYYGK